MSSFDKCVEEQGPIISTIIFGVMFVVSEVFPYIKNIEGNGIVDEIAILLKHYLKKNKRTYEQELQNDSDISPENRV